MKDGANAESSRLEERSKGLEKTQTETAELRKKFEENAQLINEISIKNLYLESYSRRENIKFMNINEGEDEDTEKGSESLYAKRTWIYGHR